MNKQIDRQAEMLKIIEDARETYANDVTDHTENEYIREGLLNANYRKTEDVAREIFEEIDKFLKSQEALSENKRLKEVGDWIFHDYLPSRLAELKKKYESEGADDV